MTTQSNNETVRKFFDSLNAGDVDGAASPLAQEYIDSKGPATNLTMEVTS